MPQTVRHFLEMIRFSHTLFALPFAMLAAAMAARLGELESPPIPVRWQDMLGVVLCMAAARSAAMAFNRIVDRRLDALNPRTSMRHLPAGTLAVSAVALFAAASSAVFVAATLLFLPNGLPIALSLPVLAFLCSYSYAKRFTAWSHVWLGMALLLAPVSAWIALRGQQVLANPLDLLPAAILGTAVLLWVAGFDMIYACQDATFDRSAGLHSIPARYGVLAALRMSAACHLGMVLVLATLPLVYPLWGWLYWCGVAAAAVLLVVEHALVRPTDLARANLAFFHVNAVLSVGLLVVGAVDLWL